MPKSKIQSLEILEFWNEIFLNFRSIKIIALFKVCGKRRNYSIWSQASGFKPWVSSNFLWQNMHILNSQIRTDLLVWSQILVGTRKNIVDNKYKIMFPSNFKVFFLRFLACGLVVKYHWPMWSNKIIVWELLRECICEKWEVHNLWQFQM